MKKLAMLAILVGSSLGCGVQGTDPSKATPPTNQEETQEGIEKAVESGAIDPATYGKE